MPASRLQVFLQGHTQRFKAGIVQNHCTRPVYCYRYLLPKQKSSATITGMKIEIFTLCDYATIDMASKLNILGSFDRINVPAMPLNYPLCAIAIKMRFDPIEAGVKRIRISFMDADGRLVMPSIDTQTQINIAPNESTATAQLVLVIPQLKLLNFGEYWIGLAVDGRQEISIPLYVRQTLNTPQVQPHQPTGPNT
jgi:hypothetical protein